LLKVAVAVVVKALLPALVGRAVVGLSIKRRARQLAVKALLVGMEIVALQQVVVVVLVR
jgi:hypothetical protein